MMELMEKERVLRAGEERVVGKNINGERR